MELDMSSNKLFCEDMTDLRVMIGENQYINFISSIYQKVYKHRYFDEKYYEVFEWIPDDKMEVEDND